SQDHGLTSKVQEPKTVDDISVRRHITGLLRDCWRHDVRDTPNFPRRRFWPFAEANRMTKKVHRDQWLTVKSQLRRHCIRKLTHLLHLLKRRLRLGVRLRLSRSNRPS